MSEAAATVGQTSIWDSGEWWMLLAAQSMAIGTVMVRLHGSLQQIEPQGRSLATELLSDHSHAEAFQCAHVFPAPSCRCAQAFRCT